MCQLGSLDGFYFSATMNNSAVNIRVQVFMRTYVFISLEYGGRSEMLGHGVTVFNSPFSIPTGKV